MAEDSTSEDDEPVVLSTLPAGGVSMNTVDTLNEGDVFDIVGPLVIDTRTDCVTHLNFVVDDTHHFVGWNPTTERWEQIVVVEDEDGDEDDNKDEDAETGEDDETVILNTAISLCSDEIGDPELQFEEPVEPSIDDIMAFVWEYVEYTNPDTEHLYNVMDEAREEL